MVGKKKTGVVKAKIHRAIYSFNVSKLFIPIKRFAKKPEGLTQEAIRESLSSIFGGKKKIEDFGTHPITRKVKSQKKKSHTVRNGIIIFSVLLLSLFAYGFFIFSQIDESSTIVAPVNITPVYDAPELKVSLGESGYLDTGGPSSTRWYVVLTVSGDKLDSIDINLITQQDEIPAEVFVLRTNYLFASNYNLLYDELKERLEQKGITISEITTQNVLNLPKKRKIILFVPSGNMPSLFVGQDRPDFDMKTFTDAGNILIYMGFSPNEGVLTEDSVIPQPLSSTFIRERFGLAFTPSSGLEQPIRLGFTNPLYSVTSAASGEVRPTILGGAGEYSVNWTNGRVYFIATTLDFWWEEAQEQMAEDLSDIISKAFWGIGFSSGKTKVISVNQSVNETKIIVFTETFSSSGGGFRVSKSFGRLYVQGERTERIDNETNITLITGKALQVRFSDRPRGTIQHAILAPETLPTILTGNLFDIRYSVLEPQLGLRQLFLRIMNSSGAEVFSTPITQEPVSLRIPTATYRLNNKLIHGNYILRVTDDQGNTFSQSFLPIPEISFKSFVSFFERGSHIFTVHLEGDGDPYRVPLNNIRVSLDGRPEQTVSTSRGQIVLNTSIVTVVGNHTFTFALGKDVSELTVLYNRPISIFERPEYIIMGLITLALFAVGILITRPESVRYSIDVPEFPPLHAIAIPIKRDRVLKIFEDVNKDLRWTHTPLSIADLKIGFRRILHRGRPVLIGEYNLERILDQLSDEGLVKQAMEYYGLVSWEAEAGRSVHSMSMSRAMRDIFVNEGIPFTPFGERKDTDTLISIGGQKVFIQIYESEAVLPKAIMSSALGRTIILFEDDLELHNFLNRIHSASSTSVTFKLLLDNNKISVTTMKKLMDVLRKRYRFTYS